MLSLLEVEGFAPSMDDVTATVVLDDAQCERAYRVAVTYDAFDEQINHVQVQAWWGCDLEEHPVTDAAAVRAIERYLDCESQIRAAALERQQDHAADVAIYDRCA